MRMVSLVLLVCLPMSATAQEETLRGRLCLRKPGISAVVERCEQIEGSELLVEPQPDDRVWIWYGADYRTLALGTLAADETTIVIPDESASVLLELEGSFDRDWPQATTVSVGTVRRPPLWVIEISDIRVTRLREIRVPKGSWAFSFRANRHAPRSEVLQRMTMEPVDLGRVELEPLPQIRGMVIDREGEPLSEVMMIAEDGSPLASSTSGGEVLFEAPCNQDPESCLLPGWFRLEYTETAPLWFQVLDRGRDLDFDVVRMAPGGSLDLRIKREGVREPLFVDIVDDPKPVPPLTFYPTIETVRVPGLEERIFIENLPEGVLRLVIRSVDAERYYSEYFVSKADEISEVEVTLRPYPVTFEVVDADGPVSGLRIEIEQKDQPKHLSQTNPTSENGRAAITLWQKGRHTARVVNPGRRGGAVFDSELVQDAIRIELGDSKASGRVFSDETGKPVAGATVRAENGLYDGNLAPASVTDESGSYEIEGLMKGSHLIHAMANGYLDGYERITAERGPNPVDTILLKKGTTYTITARWEDGAPVVGAAFFWKGNQNVEPQGYTDEAGQFRITRVVPPEPQRFWIIPVEGSFLEGELYTAAEIDVDVPAPAERVVLDFRDSDGKPADYAHVAFSFNGLYVQPGLKFAIELIQGKKFHSGPASRLVIKGLAPGSYEFVALRAFSESDAAAAGRFGKPTTVHVGPVEQSGIVEVRELQRRCQGDFCFYY